MPAEQRGDELEQIAHTSDVDAVRRDFDAYNATWMAVQTAIFAIANFLVFAYSMTVAKKTHPPFAPAVAFAALILSIAAAWIGSSISSARRPPHRRAMNPAARVVSRNLPDWVFVYYVFQFAALAYATGRSGPLTFGVFFPWVIIGARMSFARRATLHAIILAVACALAFVRSAKFTAGNATGFAAMSAVPVAAGAFVSRRARQRVLETWSERRASAREQLRMRDELRYAREIQLSMLPDAPPDLAWADIAAISIPATEVGGDYFDYIQDGGKLAVICGDVAGHGMASGITLSALRGGMILLRHSFSDPAAVLERLNDVVVESSRRRTIVTLTAALFDPVRQHVTIANAGHPPVFVRHGSGHVDVIELFGPPLGARRDDGVPQRELPFASGDVFVLHSDGIYEAANAAGEQYGLERLANVLASANGSAAEVRDEILHSVDDFRGDAAQQDDVTVVVVRIT